MSNEHNQRAIHVIGSTEDGIARAIHVDISNKGRASQFHIATPETVHGLVARLIADPDEQTIFFLPDFQTLDGIQAIKEVRSIIRSERKDLFLVLASPTSGVSPEEQYFTALEIMKSNHANLALAYDDKTGLNMVVVPEEAYYGQTADRSETLNWLIKIALARAGETFTRSNVIAAPPVSWMAPEVSENFRQVVDHLVAHGAYKKFRGKTAGHFAIRGMQQGEFLTSRRNHDFNRLSDIGLVRVFAQGRDEVVAHGSKPSVGGQSQRIIFDQHPELSNIVHFHSPLRPDARDVIPVQEQWPFECGSHQCGQNTANGLREVRPGIYAVMLENHGPNIVFGNDIPANQVIDLINCNFNLTAKTGYVPNDGFQNVPVLALQ